MTSVSVIIPTYNRAEYLQRALLSVKKQSHACAELIVIDDGSTDSTRELTASFASRCDFPVHYCYQKNKGAAAARNTGIKKAKHQLLAFLDSDDHWKKKKLELQTKALAQHPNILIAHTREQWLRCGVHLNQKKIHQPRHGDIFSHCLQLCAVGMSTVMARKEFFAKVGLFNEEFLCCEDYDLWLRSSHRFPFLLVDVPLTVKEGGRKDQVSYQYRIGMDRFRIFSVLDLLQEGCMSLQKQMVSLQELEKKCSIYGYGCVKHRREEEGICYLQIAEWARVSAESGKLLLDDAKLRAYRDTAHTYTFTRKHCTHE